MPRCTCCKHDWVGLSGVMCTNCWEWITEKMHIDDIAMVVAGIHHREPENRHAREICYYLVGDNYSHGTSKLAQGNYRITVERINKGDPKALLELIDNSEPNHELADAIEEVVEDNRTLPIQTEKRKSKLFGIFKK